MTPVYWAPKYKTTKVNCTTYENLKNLMSILFFVPLTLFSLHMAGHQNHLDNFQKLKIPHPYLI